MTSSSDDAKVELTQRVNRPRFSACTAQPDSYEERLMTYD